jgi:hypothetical protein
MRSQYLQKNNKRKIGKFLQVVEEIPEMRHEDWGQTVTIISAAEAIPEKLYKLYNIIKILQVE